MFVYGIRDPDIKLSVCSTLKRNFAETVAFALPQETAQVICRPQMDEVQKVEAVEEKQGLLNKLKEIVNQVLRENGQKAKRKCFNRGKGGHFNRNCKAPWNRSRPVPLTRRYAAATPKAPGGRYVKTSSSKRISGKPQDSEDYPKAKVSEIESNKQI